MSEEVIIGPSTPSGEYLGDGKLSTCYMACVQWEYEDNLPPEINSPHFDAMFELSKVDVVRMYPFIVWNGKRIYLGAP